MRFIRFAISPWALLIVGAFLIKASFLIASPLGQLPDEIFMYERIHFEALEKIDKSLVNGHSKTFNNNEYFHPPLYFLLNSYILKFFLTPQDKILSFSEGFYRFGFFLRIESLIFSMFSLFLVFKTLNFLRLDPRFRLLAFSFSALLPTLSVFSGAIHVHVFSLFFTNLFVYLALLYSNNINYRSAVFLGSLAGLSLLIRTENFVLIIFICVYFYLSKKSIFFQWKNIIVFFAATFIAGGWWIIGNIITFGNAYDPLYLHSSVQGMTKAFGVPNFLYEVYNKTFETFVFAAGRYNNIRVGYFYYETWKIFLLITVFVSVQIIRLKSFPERTRYFLLAMFAMLLANIFAMLYYNLTVALQAQGRYLYHSLTLFSIVIAIGTVHIFKSHYKLALIFMLALLFVSNYIGLASINNIFNGE